MTVTYCLHVRLYGAFEVRWENGPTIGVNSSKLRALLAILATAPKGTHTRAWLQDMLWGRSGPEHGRASLRRALSDLRKKIGPGFDEIFHVTNFEVCLRPDAIKKIGSRLDGEFLEGLQVSEEKFNDWLQEKRLQTSGAGGSFNPSDARNEGISPVVAIIPFLSEPQNTDTSYLGDLIAMEIARALSRSRVLDVISHMSSRRFGGRLLDLEKIHADLNTDYVLSGTVRGQGASFQLDVDLIDTNTGKIAWTRHFSGKVSETLSGDGGIVQTIADAIGVSILMASIELAKANPIPELPSHALFMSALSAMHQHHLGTFARARAGLEELIQRFPNHSVLYAWLAKWYTLAISQGWSAAPEKDINIARDFTKRALDLNPFCPTSLTIDGMVLGSKGEGFSIANERFGEATRIDPNNALAWLMYSRMQSFDGAGAEAVRFAERACALSPLDPHGYFFDIMRALALMVEGRFDEALVLAKRSVATNPRHTSSYRVLAITLQSMGKTQEARQAVAKLMKLEPKLTVEGYLRSHPAAAATTGQAWASALQSAGVPLR